MNTRIAILGAGNIGIAIANGLVAAEFTRIEDIILTRRKIHLLDKKKKQGFTVSKNNIEAVRNAKFIIIAVEPKHVAGLLKEINDELSLEKHIIISVVTGVTIDQQLEWIGKNIPFVRAMPNTGIAVRESMTCLSSNNPDNKAIEIAKSMFETVGTTIIIDEEKMSAATALGACGVAFFLRAIRAASQGGIEIGFHAEDALAIAAQTAKGAASLLLASGNHPESEIDKVTTPRGCTIAGLNQMEHEGFSSAMIKGIAVSAEKASRLYKKNGD